MKRIAGFAVILAMVALGLGGCLKEDSGYVEIKASPGYRLPAMALEDSVIGSLKEGDVVLRRPVGPARLRYAQGNDLVAFCNIDVRKNRIVTVTVSGFGREPRCRIEN